MRDLIPERYETALRAVETGDDALDEGCRRASEAVVRELLKTDRARAVACSVS